MARSGPPGTSSCGAPGNQLKSSLPAPPLVLVSNGVLSPTALAAASGRRSSSIRPKGSVRTRVVVPILITVDSTAEVRAEVVGMPAKSMGERDIVVAASIRNRGNAIARAPFVFSIETETRGELATADSPAILILPGHVRTVAMHLQGDFAGGDGLSVNVFFRFGPEADRVVVSTVAITVAKP